MRRRQLNRLSGRGPGGRIGSETSAFFDPATLPSPLFRWAMDEGGGSTLANSFASPAIGSQSDYNATISGATWGSGGLQCNGINQYAYTADFPAPLSLPQFTFHCTLNRLSGAIGDGFEWYACLADWPSAWALMESQGGSAGAHNWQTPIGYLASHHGQWARIGQWAVVSATYDGATVLMYVNGGLVGKLSGTGTATMARALLANINNVAWGKAVFSETMGFSACHTISQVRSAYEFIRSKLTAAGQTLAPTINLAVEGDSITVGVDGSTGNPSIYGYSLLGMRNMVSAGHNISGQLFATSGTAIGGIVARAATVDATLWPGRTNILSIVSWSNDGGSDPVDFVATLKAYCLARRTAGWKVVVGTPMLGQPQLSNQAYVQGVIDGILNDSSFYDAVARFDQITMSEPYPDTTDFPDNVHPTVALYALMEPIWVDAMESLM